jgi:hypothetical protein
LLGIGARILSFLSLHISLFIVVPQTLVLMDSRDQYVEERSSQGEESVEQALHRQVTRLSEIGRWQWTSSEIARGRVNGESDRPGVQMGYNADI